MALQHVDKKQDLKNYSDVQKLKNELQEWKPLKDDELSKNRPAKPPTARITELEKILDEVFENVLGALGAGYTIKPDKQNEDLANRVHKILIINNYV